MCVSSWQLLNLLLIFTEGGSDVVLFHSVLTPARMLFILAQTVNKWWESTTDCHRDSRTGSGWRSNLLF